MGLLLGKFQAWEWDEGEDGFLAKSKPLVGPPALENGLVEEPVSLAMGFKGEGGREGEEGVESARPMWVLTLRMRVWSTGSGLQARRMSSESSRFMRRYPMIFEAFSGSKFLILERTTFVASHEPIRNETLKESEQEMKWWKNKNQNKNKNKMMFFKMMFLLLLSVTTYLSSSSRFWSLSIRWTQQTHSSLTHSLFLSLSLLSLSL